MAFCDAKIDKALRPTTNFWCRATGKTNVALATTTLLVGVAILMVQAIISLPTESSAVGIIGDLLVVGIWTCCLFWRLQTHRMIKELLRNPPADESAIPVELYGECIHRIVIGPLMLAFVTGVMIVTQTLSGIGAVLYVMSFYQVLHINSGGKSWAKRAKESVVSAAAKAKALIPPLRPPVPIPLGNA